MIGFKIDKFPVFFLFFHFFMTSNYKDKAINRAIKGKINEVLFIPKINDNVVKGKNNV